MLEKKCCHRVGWGVPESRRAGMDMHVQEVYKVCSWDPHPGRELLGRVGGEGV